MHVVHERLRPVDLDDRDALAVAALEFRVARDVDLLEVERGLRADPFENAAGGLAEVAAARGVEPDLCVRAYG
jgi:hypothetical protein